MLLPSGSKLVMTGDSITDCDRDRPVGEPDGGLGNGYVSLVNALLYLAAPAANIHVVNTGVGGNTSRDLLERLEPDVLELKPDYVSIMIGINDVWRRFDAAQRADIQVDNAEYERNLRAIIEKVKPAVKTLFLFTPFYMEKNPQDAMREMTDQLCEIVRRLAAEYGVVLVDAQAAFDRLLEQIPHSARLGWDRVHPDTKGHLLIAQTFMDCIR